MPSDRKQGPTMMPFIRTARVLCDNRSHRTFGTASDGMRISRAIAYAILASLAREQGADDSVLAGTIP